MWKNKKKQYKNNKLKIIVPARNDEFELLDGYCFVSATQDYIEYIIKKHETLKQFLLFIFTSMELIID